MASSCVSDHCAVPRTRVCARAKFIRSTHELRRKKSKLRTMLTAALTAARENRLQCVVCLGMRNEQSLSNQSMVSHTQCRAAHIWTRFVYALSRQQEITRMYATEAPDVSLSPGNTAYVTYAIHHFAVFCQVYVLFIADPFVLLRLCFVVASFYPPTPSLGNWFSWSMYYYYHD